MIELHSPSPAATHLVAGAIARLTRAGDLIVLAGEMGAVRLVPPTPGVQIKAIRVLFGGMVATQTVTLHIWDDSSSGFNPPLMSNLGAELYNGDFQLTGSNTVLQDMDLTSAGVMVPGAFIVALTIAQALIAVNAYSRVAFSWIAGVVVFVGVCAVIGDLFLRVEIGFLAGALASCGLMLLQLPKAMSKGLGAERLLDVFEHEPLEL